MKEGLITPLKVLVIPMAVGNFPLKTVVIPAEAGTRGIVELGPSSPGPRPSSG